MVNCNVPRFKPPITPSPISQDATWWFQREIWSQATPAAISCRRDITSVDSRFKLSCGSKMVRSLTCYRWLQVISCCNSMICNLRNGFVEFDHHMQKVLTQRSINEGRSHRMSQVDQFDVLLEVNASSRRPYSSPWRWKMRSQLLNDFQRISKFVSWPWEPGPRTWLPGNPGFPLVPPSSWSIQRVFGSGCLGLRCPRLVVLILCKAKV